MRLVSSLLVLLVVSQAASCQAPDACEGQSGTCLSVLVQGSLAPIDAVRFDLSGTIQHSFTRMLPPGTGALPVQEGVALPAGVQGFVDGAEVTFGGVPASYVARKSATELTARVPVNRGKQGPVPVAVQYADGRNVARSALFSYYTTEVEFSTGQLQAGKNPASIAIGDVNGTARPTWPSPILSATT